MALKVTSPQGHIVPSTQPRRSARARKDLSFLFRDEASSGESPRLSTPKVKEITVSSRTLRALDSLPIYSYVRKLDIEEWDDKQIKSLALKFPGVTSIKLRAESASDHTIEKIVETWPHLEKLDIADSEEVTDLAVSHISRLFKLRELKLYDCTSITDDGLKPLAGLFKLQSLDLGSCSITDRGIEHLKFSPELRKLDLMGCAVGDATVEHLGSLPKLEEVILEGTDVSDAGLADLWKMAEVKRLSITDCHKITSGVLRYLGEMRSLKAASLGCNGLSEESIQALRRLLPNLKISTKDI